MAIPHTLARITVVLCVSMLSVSCSNHTSTDRTGSEEVAGVDSAALPQPQVKGGSITGMPDGSGTGPAISTIQPLSTTIANAGTGVVASGNPNTAADAIASATDKTPQDITTESIDPPAVEPTPRDAVAVIHEYYSSINRHDFAHAWALWSDQGHSSGQTPQQFADGYADTADVSVQMQAPERVDAAAGSRYIEIPVTIAASRRDGSEHHYAGIYTLRRSTVDGATVDQRAWRIASAQLHEIPQ